VDTPLSGASSTTNTPPRPLVPGQSPGGAGMQSTAEMVNPATVVLSQEELERQMLSPAKTHIKVKEGRG
jgi:hypothetical protein